MKECVFCKIVRGESCCSKIYEDKDLMAFLSIQPINEGHALVIPKKHSILLSETDDKIVSKMLVLAKKISIAIKKSGIKSEGVNFFLADGEAGGQEIFHTHLHIIPRNRKDGFGFKFPKNFHNKTRRSKLDAAAKKIKDGLR